MKKTKLNRRRAAAGNAIRQAVMIDALERRFVLAPLIIDATVGADTISVVDNAGNLEITVNGTMTDHGAAVDALTINGDAGGDTITITSLPASVLTLEINGEDGADTITGSPIGDTINGGAGDDTINGGLGPDTLDGGADNDTLTYASRGSAVTVTMDGVANDGAALEADNVAPTFETIEGGSAADQLDASDVAFPVTLMGNGGNDTLTGGSANDSLNGGAGADSLVGGDGNDAFHGGTGTDADQMIGGPGVNSVLYDGRSEDLTITLDGTANDGAAGENDFINGEFSNVGGGDGNDSITGNADSNFIAGGNGNDSLHGGLGALSDTLIGDGGFDTVSYAGRTENLTLTLDGTANDGAPGENDFIDASVDNLRGGEGNDSLTGSADPNTLMGGGGNDTLNGGLGNDDLHGGDGTDTATYAGRNEALTITLDGTANDGATGEGDNVMADVENVTGGNGNDAITGSAAANLLSGGAGSDTLNGGDGDDTLDGGLGADVFNGDAGSDTATYASRTENLTVSLDGVANDGAAGENDQLSATIENLITGSGNDTITGSATANFIFANAGNDTIDGGLGADYMSGGAGTDTVTYASRTAAVSVRLDGAANDGEAGELDRIASDVENVIGGSGNDSLVGASGNNELTGGAGNDTLYGLGGNDVFFGGDGNDRIIGGTGNDTVDGGTGPDVIYGNDGDDSLFGSVGRDRFWGGAGNDRMKGGSHNDTMLGEAGNDSMYGDGQDDNMDGGAGDDQMLGGAGNDVITGGTGVDRLFGEAGNDSFFTVDSSADRVDGGLGTDTAEIDELDRLFNTESST